MVQLNNNDADFLARLLRTQLKELDDSVNSAREFSASLDKFNNLINERLGLSPDEDEFIKQKEKTEKEQELFYQKRKAELEQALLLIMGGSENGN